MYFDIKCIGKLPGPTNEFERSLVFDTGEFERPKFDCNTLAVDVYFMILQLISYFHECTAFFLGGGLKWSLFV